ncbi:MAG: right-handed parallel beta-helix repeat-containing protein, partial [Anaerolineae bacterium]|nr:right-handed parallel beta-helix repeat-containing protein [Anaerolineae bacterium]
MKHRLWFIGLIAALLFLAGGVVATIAAGNTGSARAETLTVPAAAPQAPLAYTTVITVNTTEDTSGETQTKTCYFTQSIYFAASDGKCNLRRALVEASHRPEAHRPILIKFNIPITDTNYNAITGTWTIVMDADYSSSASGEALVQGGLDNPKNPDSYITIDGATQGEIGGRSNGDPIIIINSEHVLDLVGVNYNTIRNLAFNGGGGIFSNDVSGVGGNNLIENVWVGLNADGTEIVPGSNPDISLAGGGISIQGDNNTISNTIVTGSNTGISIEGDNNLVQYNAIGTRGDRTIPAERLTCVASNLYNPAQWYGGWGINITSGSNNQIVHNTIAGAHSPHSPTETAPPAIWTAGGDVLVAYNTIGIDGDGVEVGTCGQGIFVTGQGVQILNNTIVNAHTSFFNAESEDPTEGAIFVNDGSPLARQYVMRDNVVRDSTSKAIEFGPAVPESLRLFEPPRIVSIDGLTVVGETEVGYDCPNCLVDLYLDDLDDEQDALERLTTAVIDNVAGTARFTATLSSPLPANHGIRVAAVTQDNYVIGDFLAGTTTMLSPAYAPDATFTRQLAPGWNLFSIDVTPPDPAIGTVLSSLAGQYDVVLSFDGGPSGGGHTYDPANPGASDLTTLDVTHGYWIHITAATTQTLTLAYEPARDDTPIQLYEGWNLVSYLPDRTLPITQALESISGAYDIVRGFDGGALTYMPAQPQYSDLTELEPGYAYWIKIKTGQGAPVLTYPGADTPIMLLLGAGESATPAQPQGVASADFFSPTTEWTDFYGVATLSGFS